jgi:FkbM family methyltransferase
LKKIKRHFRRLLADKFPKIAATFRELKDIKNFNQSSKMTQLGFMFCGHKGMQRGTFEQQETVLIQKILSRIDVLVNVGANIGYYVCLGLQNNKKVIAFEPIASNLKYLLRNIKINGWQNNVEIFPVALSNKAGIIEIYGGGTGASLIKGWAQTPDSYLTLVPSSTMNVALGERLKGKKILLIVDIEGAENMMLEGSSILLDMNPKPIWFVEICCTEHQPKGIRINPNLLQTFEKFWDKGYDSMTADRFLRAITKSEILKIIETQVDTLGVHNFIFYEKGKKPI